MAPRIVRVVTGEGRTIDGAPRSEVDVADGRAAASRDGPAPGAGATRACSGPPLTFDDVVSGSELLLEGTVEELMLDGMAYRLRVMEVFKGTVLGDEVRIGPASGPVGRGCEVGLQLGKHVVLGVVDADAPLNSLATAVWSWRRTAASPAPARCGSSPPTSRIFGSG